LFLYRKSRHKDGERQIPIYSLSPATGALISKGFKHKEKKYRSRNQDKNNIRHAIIFSLKKII